VGAPRCGTTSLHESLAQHPRVFMSEVKEPHYFALDYRREYDEHAGREVEELYRTLEQYLELFDGATDEQYRGESSVYYLYSKVAPVEIQRMEPDARIIVMIRNPLDFLLSLHARLLVHADENCRSFPRALELETRRRKGLDLPPKVRHPSLLYYSRYARFADHIDAYRRLFPAEQIHVIVLEDFHRQREQVYGRMLDFLGLERTAAPEQADRNANFEPRSILLTQFLQERGPRRVVHAGDGLLTRKLHGARHRARRLLWRINKRHGARRALDPAVRRELMGRFLPEVERLSEMLDRDLVRLWGYDGIEREARP
jgi:hypothetical protein